MVLSEQIIALIEHSKTNDYHQRSAIGMARSWLDTHELHLGVNTLDMKPGRDTLAADIVRLMDGVENEECVEALQAARRHVNKPFQSAVMLGFQARRAERGVIGSAKKNEKNK